MIIPRPNQNHLPKKHNFFRRDNKNFNEDYFLADYRNIKWDEILNFENQDVNASTEKFLTTFETLLDKHLPLKKLTNKQYKQKYKPWVTKEVIDLIKSKQKLLKGYINGKNKATKAS